MPRRDRSPRRRTALLAAGAVLALAGPALVALTPAPALADDPCLTETNTDGSLPLTTKACDDSTPPVTDLPTVSPDPTVFGYTRSSTLTFTLHSHYTDADPDPVSYQCQFWNADTTAAPDPVTGTWDDCGTGTVTKQGLADSVGSSYHLRARAVDAGDSMLTRVPHTEFGTLTDTPDLDTSFDAATQEVTFRIDTSNPNTFLTDEPTDDLRPDEPSVLSQDVTLTLDFFDNSKEIAGYLCALNGKRVPCRQGSFRLVGLGPGKKTFAAITVDKAGNHDPVPAEATFWVPRNLSTGMGGTGAHATAKSCSRVVNAAYFAGDYVQCRTEGDMLHFAAPSPRTRELRLIAPAGPRLGVVEVNVGEGRWIPVDLYSPTQQAVHTYLVRDQYEPPKGGQIRVRVKTVTAARPYVRVDAVLARP